jgi:hypothetical protein
MRTAILILLLSFARGACALEWKSELFHCAAKLPDSNGWQTIEAPPSPGVTTLVVTQHLGRQSVFGINIVENLPATSVADPAVRQTLEKILRQFGYQFVGYSSVKVGGLDWLQYPVRSGAGAQAVSGLIRFASAGGYIFGITMLRGGGKDAASDAELQQAAASFRVLPAIAATAQPAQAPSAKLAAAAPAAPQPASDSPAKAEPASASEEAAAASGGIPRLAWGIGAGVVVLVLLFSIIGSGKSGKN